MKRGLALLLSALLLAAVLTGCTGAPAPSAEVALLVWIGWQRALH